MVFTKDPVVGRKRGGRKEEVPSPLVGEYESTVRGRG